MVARLHLARATSSLVLFNIVINVYNSLVQLHFGYCNVVWGNCEKRLAEKLQNLKLQNREALIFMSDDVCRSLRWRNPTHQRIRKEVYSEAQNVAWDDSKIPRDQFCVAWDHVT